MQKILYFSVFLCLNLKFSSALPQEALRFPEDAFSTRGVFHNKNTPDCSSCVCGERNEEPRIVGGVMASMNAFPWIGRLTFRSSFGCGGSLINDRYLLTAAHCIRGHFWFMFRVTFGEHDRCDKSQRPFTRYLTKIISKDFSLNDLTDDIALLKLSSPVTYSHAVRPVCLPKNPERTYENTKSIVAGWGATGENQNWSCVLMEAELPVLSHKQCQRTKYNASKIHETMLCAGFPETGHKDACTGDSGGPLVSETPDHAYELIGIVSYGFGCARIGFPGVYTRVTKYLDWIQENTDDACYCREE